jgi:hypothetical protein
MEGARGFRRAPNNAVTYFRGRVTLTMSDVGCPYQKFKSLEVGLSIGMPRTPRPNAIYDPSRCFASVEGMLPYPPKEASGRRVEMPAAIMKKKYRL